MPSCCIKQCGARKNKNHPELSLHRFPTNEILKRKWLEVIGMENINNRLLIWRVCSLHFNESSFNRTLDVIRLHDDAIPSCSLPPVISDRSIKTVLDEGQNVPESNYPAAEVIFPEDNLSTNVQQSISASRDSHLQTSTSKSSVNDEKVQSMIKKCALLKKQVKCLNEKVKRRDKKIAHCTEIIKNLKNRNVINNEEKVILEE